MGALRPVGELLREWRQRRRLSQLDLALDAEISTRHLSFVETGRAVPSREMVLRLAEQLEVPMRERNALLLAAGFAPMFAERTLDDPALDTVRTAVAVVLERQKPYPAFAIDRHWQVVASNRALPQLYAGVDEALLKPPVNGMRLSLHPQGLAPRIANLAEWRAHLLARLRRQIELSADATLTALLKEMLSYPAPPHTAPTPSPTAVLVPLQIATPAGVLSFFSTTTVFGTPLDVTLAEMAVELFFAADTATEALVHQFDSEAVVSATAP